MAVSLASNLRIVINVGGKTFETSRKTLESQHAQGTVFASMDLAADVFIDRNPQHFDKVLDFLRDGWCVLPQTQAQHSFPLVALRELRNEACFYNIPGLLDLIDQTSVMRKFFTAVSQGRQAKPVDPGIFGMYGGFGVPLPVGMMNRNDDATDICAILKTASKAEIAAAEALARADLITLKVVGVTGQALGEFEVSASEPVASWRLSDSLRRILQNLVQDGGRAQGGYTDVTDRFSLVTPAGTDLFARNVGPGPGAPFNPYPNQPPQPTDASRSSLELLGVKHGDTLTAVFRAEGRSSER